MADHFNKETPKTHFIKLNNIFSIFIFIFIFSSFVSLCSYTHHFSTFDRHYIFLLCNGILVFLIMNFNSNHVSSPKEIHSVITNEINHPQVLIPSANEIVAPIKKQEEEKEEVVVVVEEEIKKEDNEIEQIDYGVCVIGDQIEYQKAEIHFGADDEQETEELNKKCVEFITKMKERMRLESLSRHTRVLQTQIDATNSF